MSKLKRFFILCLSVGLLTGCGLTANKDSNHIFTYAMGEKWQTLDSSKANDRTSYTLIHTFMEGLYEYKRNDDGILKPKADLVKKLKHSDDMKVYTIQLRKNAKWSNGDQITANDFVYSWRRALTMHTENAKYMTSEGIHIKGADEIYAGKAKADTLGVQEKNKHTLVIEMTKEIEKAKLIDYLTLPVFYPLNMKFVEEKGKSYGTSMSNVLTNGPFKLHSLTNNKAVVYKWNQYYDEKKVKLNGIEMLFNVENSERIKMFDHAQIDLVSVWGPELKKYKKKSTLTGMPAGVMWSLLPNFKSNTMRSKSLRKAISLSINRSELEKNQMRSALLNSKDDVIDLPDGLVPKNIEYDTLERNIRELSKAEVHYSKKKAKKIVKNYLKSNNLKDIHLTLAYPTDYEIGQFIAKELKKDIEKNKGTKVDLVEYNPANKDQYDLTLVRREAVANDGAVFVDMLSSNNGLSNYHNHEYDVMIEKIKNPDSYDDKFDMIAEAELKAVNDYAAIPIAQQSYAILSRMNALNVDFVQFGVPINFKYVELS